jgi:hypothetical protein
VVFIDTYCSPGIRLYCASWAGLRMWLQITKITTCENGRQPPLFESLNVPQGALTHEGNESPIARVCQNAALRRDFSPVYRRVPEE